MITDRVTLRPQREGSMSKALGTGAGDLSTMVGEFKLAEGSTERICLAC